MDDEPTTRMLVVEVLEENGYRTIEPAMEVITKPFVIATFVNKIRDLIDRAPSP